MRLSLYSRAKPQKYCGEDAEGGRMEQVLVPRMKAQLEDVAERECVDRANGQVGGSQAHGGGEVIDGVDPAAQPGEVGFSEPESGLCDVAGVDTYPRCEGVLPDVGQLHACAQALQPVLGTFRAHDAVDAHVRIPGEKIAHKKAPHEAGRACDEDLAKVGRRDRGFGVGPRGGRADQLPQRVQVALAMCRKGAGQRWHGVDTCRRLRHALPFGK